MGRRKPSFLHEHEGKVAAPHGRSAQIAVAFSGADGRHQSGHRVGASGRHGAFREFTGDQGLDGRRRVGGKIRRLGQNRVDPVIVGEPGQQEAQ